VLYLQLNLLLQLNFEFDYRYLRSSEVQFDFQSFLLIHLVMICYVLLLKFLKDLNLLNLELQILLHPRSQELLIFSLLSLNFLMDK